MSFKTDPAHLRVLREKLLEKLPESKDMLQGIQQNNPEYEALAQIPASLIFFLCGGEEQRLTEILEGYMAFSDTFKQKQFDFVRSGHYAHQDFHKVNSEVYQNERYMTGVYYPALLCSYLFSQNYFEILRVFTERFIPLSVRASGRLCEIGLGHGFLSSYLLQQAPGLTGVGLDISAAACAMIEKVGQYFELKKNIHVQVSDACAAPIPMADGQPYCRMICAEVLEHLAEPEKLLRHIHSVLAEDGLCFLTASINMESVDHLYLFHSEAEVHQLVQSCGFNILETVNAFLSAQPYRQQPGLSEKLMKRGNPATVILIVEKKR